MTLLRKEAKKEKIVELLNLSIFILIMLIRNVLAVADLLLFRL